MTTNWSDPKSKITPNFIVREACLLPSWGVLHQPSEDEQANLFKICNVMEKIRVLVAKPVRILCMIRPGSVNSPGDPHHGQDYNTFVKGAKMSAHRVGLACDFIVAGMTGDEVREMLKTHLDDLGCRMENLAGASWVHIDLYPSGASGRYFKP